MEIVALTWLMFHFGGCRALYEVRRKYEYFGTGQGTRNEERSSSCFFGLNVQDPTSAGESAPEGKLCVLSASPKPGY
jgi:hypothetical protein